MRLPHHCVVLIVDGSRMLLLRNQGDPTYPDLRVIEHREIQNPPNHDILSDAPGVGGSRGYPGKDTFERSDPHQVNEDRFVAGAASALAEVSDAAGGLIVVAPSDALGELRRHYDDSTRHALIAEIDKDLVKHTVEDITRLLAMHEERSPS